jgi:hypothetical protein
MITFHLDAAAADHRHAGQIQALRHRSLLSLRRDVGRFMTTTTSLAQLSPNSR